MKIQAAARLVASNESAARAYVKSVFGVEPGDTVKSHVGLYEFRLKTTFDKAKAKADAAFDHEPKKGTSGQAGSKVLRWDMEQGRELILKQSGHDDKNVSVTLTNF